MERKDFSAIAALLRTNGVSFVTLFFKINFNPDELNEHDGPKEFIADFSDGVDYLGSLTIKTTTISDTSANWTVQPYEMGCYGVTTPELSEEMKIVFYFTCPYNRGECTIELPDSYDSFEN